MTRRDLSRLLAGADDAGLFAEARRVKTRWFGQAVFLRGIVEFSSHCRQNCHYCGLRAASLDLARYRLDRAALLESLALAAELGLGTAVLQGGEDPDFPLDLVAEAVTEARSRHGLAVTLSLGELPLETYRFLRDCGADRVLLKVETFDAALYERLRPGRRLAERLALLLDLRELGFEIGSGVIAGLPGAAPDQLAEDLLRLAALAPPMLSVGPFIPHPATPLGTAPPGDPSLALRATAILRLLVPGANIPATSALGVAAAGGRGLALAAGANVIMPSVTPEGVRRGYAIYPGKNDAADGVRDRVRAIREEIRAAGGRPCGGRGDALVDRGARPAGPPDDPPDGLADGPPDDPAAVPPSLAQPKRRPIREGS